MPKIAVALAPKTVASLSAPGVHPVGGVSGLLLQIQPSGARSWILRTMVGEKRRDIGLGAYPAVGLASAREKAQATKDKIRAGVDPVAERAAAKAALKDSQAKAKTFDQCAAAYIEAHESAWKNTKHGQQWRNTIEVYASPVLGSMLVRDIQMSHVLAVLGPIWKSKTETASRLRGRIESILDWAKGRGFRSGDNPAAWKGNLDAQLPKAKRLAKVEHHPALPAEAMPEFMTRLRAADGLGARALEFAILTAARSGEVRGARWDEIDLKHGAWTVPAGRMKAGKEHRVPLSSAAVALLKRLPRIEGTDLVFPSTRKTPLSDMTLSAVLRRMAAPAVPHGFRSTFRDWAAERTNYPSDMAEMALAHVISNAVEAAYRRGDMFEKRRAMMDAWATFCSGGGSNGKAAPRKKTRA